MPSKEAVKEIMKYHFNRLGIPLVYLNERLEKCYSAMNKFWGSGNDWCLDIHRYCENLKRNKYYG
jgi:hypothetical protein